MENPLKAKKTLLVVKVSDGAYGTFTDGQGKLLQLIFKGGDNEKSTEGEENSSGGQS